VVEVAPRVPEERVGVGPLRLVPIQVEPTPIEPIQLPTPCPRDTRPAWEIVTARGHVLRVHRGIEGGELAAVLAALGVAEGRR
jgi:hypothetical protein